MGVVKVTKPMYYWHCEYCSHRTTTTYVSGETAYRDLSQHIKDHHAALDLGEN